MLVQKKHFSFILVGLFILGLSILSGCSTDGTYQSPWSTPDYDPNTYNAAKAEQDKNFPVFGNSQPSRYTPIPDPYNGQPVAQQNLPEPNGMARATSTPYYKIEPPKNQDDFAYSSGNTEMASAVQPSDYMKYGYNSQQDNTKQVLSQSADVKVGVLLPLSGQTAEIGKAILNAMQLALFDIADSKVAMVVKDTKGTPDGAKQAAKDAINDGAQIILGPLFSSGVKEVAPIARQRNINVITFSTDWTTASDNVFVMGFLPFTQVRRVVEYATRHGHSKLAALSPKTGYGAAVLNTLQRTLRENALPEAKIERFSPIDNNISPLVRDFTNYDKRTELMTKHKEELMLLTTPEAQDELSLIEHKKTYGDMEYDAVLLPVGGDFAKQIASLFPYFEVDTNTVKLLGTGLWDDDDIIGEMALQGAWFSAPDPSLRKGFERDYFATYSERPPRIATLGYDAMALIAVLSYKGMRTSGVPYFGKSYLTNPNGFAGIDGIFRFRADGLVERGLAVLEIQRTGARVIDPAPRSFMTR